VDPDSPTAADDELIRQELVKVVGKRRIKLSKPITKACIMVYGQCLDDMKEKLEASRDWERIQSKQSLHELIQKIKRVCVGFNDCKQEVFNLVQVLKMLFLYTQNKKHGVKEYGRNFCSLWNTVKVFGGNQCIHKGMVGAMLQDPKRVANITNPMANEIKKVHVEASEAVKAALLISGADKQRFGKLKDDLANNYFLGSDQYPYTFDKALQVLGNYQAPKNMLPYRGSPSTRVVFIQHGCGTGWGAGQGKEGAGRGGSGSIRSVGGAETSSLSGSSVGERVKTNSKGESHCYNCGKGDHWAQECPHLSNEQQQQLHMTLEGLEGDDEHQEEAYQLMHMTLAQGASLLDNMAYLDGCLTVTAFKLKKYLKEVREWDNGIRINCNAGVVVPNFMGKYGLINTWYILEGIANIFSMHELEKKHRITYDSWQGYYEVHTPS
jgi:hypothetical protein